MTVRDAIAADFAPLLRLNEASASVLSPLTPARLETLYGQAACCRVYARDGHVLAFVLAFREGSAYDSGNYRWFADRFARFLYIDRVVVDHACRRQGIGTRLYDGLFALARHAGIPRLACEFDIAPPNHASRAFHARYRFKEIGTRAVAGGKRVSLQAVDPLPESSTP